MHSVSVWASEFGLTLGQVATAEKSNEITAIPTLLSLIDIQGAIITIDAMGTQTAIAEKIMAGGGDYLLALKGNQERCMTQPSTISTHRRDDFATDGLRLGPAEKEHGRRKTNLSFKCPLPKACRG